MKFAASSYGGLLMVAHLSSRHRDTIEKIFTHPASGNVEWRDVLSLLEYLGTTTEQRNGKLRWRWVRKPKCSRSRIARTLMRR